MCGANKGKMIESLFNYCCTSPRILVGEHHDHSTTSNSSLNKVFLGRHDG